MKNIIAILMILVLCAAMFVAGRADGVRHAIEDSVIWTVDIYDPDNPSASACGIYDQLIYIDLDGESFAHGMYQG